MAEVLEDYSEILDKFRSVRILGECALVLGGEANSLDKAIELLHVTPLEAPAGNLFTLGTEDPEQYWRSEEPTPPMHTEERIAVEDGPHSWQVWRVVSSDEANADDSRIRPHRSADGLGYLFVGNLIEYDNENRKVWLYNKDRDVRAQFTDKFKLSGFIPDY